MGWKYFLLVIAWSVVFIPAIYFYWPETARLSLEEIGKQFGDEVAVHLMDATDAEKAALDAQLVGGNAAAARSGSAQGPEASNSSDNGNTETKNE